MIFNKTISTNGDCALPQINYLSSYQLYVNRISWYEHYLRFSRAILRNNDLNPETPWTNILQNDFWGTPLSHSGSHKSYRPICVFSFRLNYYYGKLNPWGYHLVNNILHTIVSILFTYLCYNLLKKTSIALFGGVIFAVHPVHTGMFFLFLPYFIAR